MNIICAICQDALEPSNDIFITPCGHVFHFPCLIQWLEKSQSCPQCRQRVNRDKIIRIYFNFHSTDDIKEDSFSLQQKLDSLSFQVKLKETECNNSRKENATLKKQVVGLKDEVKRIEHEIKSKQAAIRALTEQIKYLQEKSEDYDRLKKEKLRLESQLGQYEGVKLLINSSEEYVKKMMDGITDTSTLTTYVAVMKRELSESIDKRKQLRNTVRMMQLDIQTLKKERATISEDYLRQINQLEEALAMCRSENDMLKNKVSKLKGLSTQSSNNSEETCNSSPNSFTSRKRSPDPISDLDSVVSKKMKESSKKLTSSLSNDASDSDIGFVSPIEVKKPKENTENSPYLPTKSKNVLSFRDRSSQLGGFSLSSKRSTFSSKHSTRKDDSIVFDGFGGHSKLEIFPRPKTSPSKLKRLNRERDTDRENSARDRERQRERERAKQKKIKVDLTTNNKLDDFVINLT